MVALNFQTRPLVTDPEDRAAIYERAIMQMGEYISRGADGTLSLRIRSADEIGMDPVIFADLKRSMDETNRKILAGEVDANHVEF